MRPDQADKDISGFAFIRQDRIILSVDNETLPVLNPDALANSLCNDPESVSVKPKRAKMPGPIVACAASCRLRQVNFVDVVAPTCQAEAEAFRASAGLNASRIQDDGKAKSSRCKAWRMLEEWGVLA
jgi:hypothetical protein